MDKLSNNQLAELWAYEESYSISQVAALWVNVCPPEGWFVEPDDPDFDIAKAPYLAIVPDRHEFDRIIRLLKKAIGDGKDCELCPEYFAPDNIRDDLGRIIGTTWDSPHPDSTIVRRKDLLEWAKSKFTKLPPFLAITEKETIRLNNALNEIFNEGGDFYPRRLVVAIKAWDRVYNQLTFNKKISHNDQLAEEVEKIYREEYGCEPPKERGIKSIAYTARKNKE